MTTATAVRVELPELHPGQQEIAEHPARFKVVACGRRYGKTTLGVVMCIIAAHKGGRAWWIAPTYKITMEGWRMMRNLLSQYPGAVRHDSELRYDLPGGGVIEIRTGTDPDNLRGSGLDYVVLDEAAFLDPDAWSLVLRPALADKQGGALFISTPNHHNWFYHLYERAQEGGSWAAWQHPSWDNPYLSREEIEAARIDMGTEERFLQEFGASFEYNANSIYPHFDRTLHVRDLEPGLSFRDGAFGADYGRVHASAAVAISVDQYGRRWVREAWAAPSDDHGAELKRQIGRMRNTYALRRGRVDPNQDALIDGMPGVNTVHLAERSRQTRIEITARLLNIYPGGLVPNFYEEVRDLSPRRVVTMPDSPGLLFVKGAPGIDELCEEIEGYHYERKTSDVKDEMIVARINENRVAAMEDANEELDTPLPDYSALMGQRTGVSYPPRKVGR